MGKFLIFAVFLLALAVLDQQVCGYVDRQARHELLLSAAEIPLDKIDFSNDGQFGCKIYTQKFLYEYATCMYGHPLTSPKAVDLMYMPPRSILHVIIFGKSHLTTFAGDNALITFRNPAPSTTM